MRKGVTVRDILEHAIARQESGENVKLSKLLLLCYHAGQTVFKVKAIEFSEGLYEDEGVMAVLETGDRVRLPGCVTGKEEEFKKWAGTFKTPYAMEIKAVGRFNTKDEDESVIYYPSMVGFTKSNRGGARRKKGSKSGGGGGSPNPGAEDSNHSGADN